MKPLTPKMIQVRE